MKRIIYLLLIVVFAWSCNGSDKKSNSEVDKYNIHNPNTARGHADMGSLPEFLFSETEFNYGTLVQGEKVSHIFVFTNVGGSNLVIKDVSASCGCTTPKWTKEPIKPGEKGSIEVVFDSSGRQGEQSKTVRVEANTQPSTTELRVKCDIITN
ncbi:MAG: DUF1573 domain-containing protein [Bacteroidales bacterium]|nr:DUF1573 domain-containing protein [Bacteroidales bacterium]